MSALHVMMSQAVQGSIPVGVGTITDDQFDKLPAQQQGAIEMLEQQLHQRGIFNIDVDRLTVNGNVFKIDVTGLDSAKIDEAAHAAGFAGFLGVYTFPPSAQVGGTKKKASWWLWALGLAAIGGAVYIAREPGPGGSRRNPASRERKMAVSDAEATKRLRAIDKFTEGYMDAALWSSTDESTPSGDDPLDKNYDLNSIAPETWNKMVADCERFQREKSYDLIDSGLSDTTAGYCFWMSRNGHGVGFFDRDLEGDIGDRLQEAAEKFGQFDLYVGDDGLVHGTPG